MLRNILSVDQFNKDFINTVFSNASYYMKYEVDLIRNSPLKGKVLANLFYEPSTRTSSSFYSAMSKLGGSVIPINDVKYSSVIKGETLEDTVRTLQCYSDIIVLRHYEKGAAARASKVLDIPLINAGDGTGEHPTQSLLDLFTIFNEKNNIDGLTITMVGDLLHGRTVHSLCKLLRLYDVKLNFVSPDNLQMPSEYVRENDYQTNNLDSVIETSDIVYMTRVQKERFDNVVIIDTNYGITKEQMSIAKKDMILMHPLPRVDEIPTELDSDPRSAYFRQMKYGLYVRMALLYLLLS